MQIQFSKSSTIIIKALRSLSSLFLLLFSVDGDLFSCITIKVPVNFEESYFAVINPLMQMLYVKDSVITSIRVLFLKKTIRGRERF